MQIRDFTQTEADYLEAVCNFTPEETRLFQLRLKDKSLFECALRSERDLLRFHFLRNENKGTAPSSRRRQQSTGLLHFVLQIPLIAQNTHTEWCGCFVAE